MINWTNKQWGTIVGVLVVLAIALVGVGITALAVLAGLAGYFVGKFLDGELDLEEIRNRAQGRTQSPIDQSPYTASPTSGPAASPTPPPTDVSGGTRVR